MATQVSPSSLRSDLPREQNVTAPPVRAFPQLAAMEEAGAVKTVVKGATNLPLMGTGSPVHTGGQG